MKVMMTHVEMVEAVDVKLSFSSLKCTKQHCHVNKNEAHSYLMKAHDSPTTNQNDLDMIDMADRTNHID